MFDPIASVFSHWFLFFLRNKMIHNNDFINITASGTIDFYSSFTVFYKYTSTPRSTAAAGPHSHKVFGAIIYVEYNAQRKCLLAFWCDGELRFYNFVIIFRVSQNYFYFSSQTIFQSLISYFPMLTGKRLIVSAKLKKHTNSLSSITIYNIIWSVWISVPLYNWKYSL